jgi:hypothetical protein
MPACHRPSWSPVGPGHRAAAHPPGLPPLGCHRPRIPDRSIFDKLIQILVFGCGYRRIADQTYDRLFGLELEHLAVDGCITKAPCGGEVAGPSPVDRRKQALKRSLATDAGGIPLAHAARLRQPPR